jgi:diguanylate cyclase (GGDEF)-like protein
MRNVFRPAWLVPALLLAFGQAAGATVPAPAQAPDPAPPAIAATAPASPAAPQAASGAAAFDRLYADLRDTGLATQPDQAGVQRRLDALAALVPAGDARRALRWRSLQCEWGFDEDDTKRQLAYADDGIARARAARDPAAEANFHYCRAAALETLASTPSVMAEYEAGIAAARAAHDNRLLADGLSLRGGRRSLLGDQAHAIPDLLAAQHLYQQGGFRADAEALLLDIAISYRRMGDSVKAHDYLRQNEAFATALGDRGQLTTNLLQQGYLAEDEGRTEDALALYRRALDIARDHGSDYDVASIHLAMAWPWILRKDYTRALSLLETAQDQFAALGDHANDDMIALRRGQAHAGLGRHAQALADYALAAEALERSNNQRYLALLYHARAASEGATGRKDAAIADLGRYIDLQDTIRRAESSQQAQLLRYQFDADRRDMENRRLERERTLRDRQLKTLLQARRWQWIAIVLAGALLLLLGALVVRTFVRMRRLGEMAATDPLTGVANRRGIEQLGDDAIVVARTLHQPLCALVLDVDHFKRVNDSHGHPCGDQVLARIAHACRDALRHIDLFGRHGGEEFLVLLPDTRLAYAWPVAERLRTAVAGLSFDDIAPGLAVTVSIGMAQLRPADAGLRDLVARADAALYHAKANGRDRVEAED